VTGIRLDVYVTGDNSATAAAATAAAATKTTTSTTATAAAAVPTSAVYSEKSGGRGPNASNVALHLHQRPGVARKVAKTARDAVGRAAVLVCGPARLADGVALGGRVRGEGRA
jgi:type IV secretory pathway TrbL component